MDLTQCLNRSENILLEGAVGERLKREYGLQPDPHIAWASTIYSKEGRTALMELWTQYREVAEGYGLPFLATTPTRRGNYQCVQDAGMDIGVIFDNVNALKEVKALSKIDMFIGGLLGCKGDAYTGEGNLEAQEAYEFHSWQTEAFRRAEVDFLLAGIMPTLGETMGIARAMSDTKLPYIISFTIERNGTLIDGTTICDAILEIDGHVSEKPLCYMTNCVHPRIAYEALSQPFNQNEIVRNRFLGIQGNTSPLSYSQLEGAKELQSSEPDTFAKDMFRIKKDFNLKIIGGCCGTDARHMEHIAQGLSISLATLDAK